MREISGELIPKLKPFVSTFSEGIRYKYKKSDQLRVGGKIVSIFDVSKVTKESKSSMIHIIVDDNIGNMLLMIPKEAYSVLNKKYSFKDGMIIFAEGRLLDFQKLHEKREEAERIEPSPTATLICWLIKPYELEEKQRKEE